MKVKVLEGKCQGHGRCYAIAPEIFSADDEGYVVPGDLVVPPGGEELAERAVRACPERALEIEA
jgi:ferredoxin